MWRSWHLMSLPTQTSNIQNISRLIWASQRLWKDVGWGRCFWGSSSHLCATEFTSCCQTEGIDKMLYAATLDRTALKVARVQKFPSTCVFRKSTVLFDLTGYQILDFKAILHLKRTSFFTKVSLGNQHRKCRLR